VVIRAHPGAGASIDQGVRVGLLGPFALEIAGRSVDTPRAGQRVIALLVLLGGRAHRSRIAGELWPEQREERALSNLRSAVWRLPEAAQDLVVRHGTSLEFSEPLTVDIDEAIALARRLLHDGSATRPTAGDRELLMADLLPDVDEGWLVVPREQHRQRRLHALEALASQDLAHGQPLDAVDTALAAVSAEPLRESAQSLLIRAHLAAGNRAAARDQFRRFRQLLASDLGVAPSAALTGLITTACGRSVTPP